jgi:shikimate dehydrogenase
VVKGTTKLVGVMGNPVAHSLSPAMHNAAFNKLGLDWVYVPLLVQTDKVAAAVKGLSPLTFKGANVTVPLKEKVMPFMDQLSPAACCIGAVNTITIKDNGELVGSNTDWLGFLKHLEEIGFEAQDCKALILGSGGSSRAVVYALSSLGAEIKIAARNVAKARMMADQLTHNIMEAKLSVISTDRLGDVADVDLVVNTTPVGMSPLPELCPWPDEIPLPSCRLVYDLIYNPKVTRLMKKAEDQDIKAENGLGMLVHQAALSFELWTGVAPPMEAMRKAATKC